MASAPRTTSTVSRRSVAAPSQESQPDEVIGEFRRGKEIGKGSFATVYLAQHRKKKSYAAVKVVQMSKLTKKLKENLESEISILKSLQHPHIVALFACNEAPNFIYLVMEYCQLSDLSQFMKKRVQLSTLPETAEIFRKYPNRENGGLNEVISRHFIKQMASALEYLRSRNLIHRDIKPQNLLLNPSPAYMARQRPEDVPLAASEYSLIPVVGVNTLPMLKVADFGFARHLPSTAMAETLCGSPLYMAPEILRYEKYDARADLWSAGTVLYEMVVGKPPFRAQNHVELLRRIEKANDVITFDRNLPVSREMKNTIRSLLKKDPVERVSYERFFQDPLITSAIPGLTAEDRPSVAVEPEVSELSRRISTQPVEDAKPDDNAGRASRKTSDQDISRHVEEVPRRSSEAPEIRRQPSQREQRRPSIVGHATAPARQELHVQAAPRIERRSSRSSPLAGPPMVREASGVDDKRTVPIRARTQREKSAQDVADEREYVLIDGNQVKVNAIADEFQANATRTSAPPSSAMTRRATVQGHPNSLTGADAASPQSRGMQIISGRYGQSQHQRNPSFDRRMGGASPQSATNMLTKALNAANARLFGALGTSPPFAGRGISPPIGYAPFPSYTPPQLAISYNDEAKPVDEDTKLLRTMEEAAHRSDVIYGFAEVKLRQLLPATPSAQDGLGIQQLADPERALRDSDDSADKDMTNVAIVGVAEEALVLYVKTLSILAKTIELAGYWWSKHRDTLTAMGVSPRTASIHAPEIGKRINNIVQWARSRFNECLEKSEVVGRRLIDAQRSLPEDHPAHPNNHPANSSSGGAISASTGDHIQITSNVTAEKLMYDRAVEMSRAAAVNELVGEELQDCELSYRTAIMLFEAVLELDDEPLMRKPSAKPADKIVDDRIKGFEGEVRPTVIKLIEGVRARLSALRKKLAQAQVQQQADGALVKRHSSASGNSAYRPSSNPG